MSRAVLAAMLAPLGGVCEPRLPAHAPRRYRARQRRDRPTITRSAWTARSRSDRRDGLGAHGGGGAGAGTEDEPSSLRGVTGGDGDDRLVGTPTANNGGAGDDVLVGDAGRDTVLAGLGDDRPPAARAAGHAPRRGSVILDGFDEPRQGRHEWEPYGFLVRLDAGTGS